MEPFPHPGSHTGLPVGNPVDCPYENPASTRLYRFPPNGIRKTIGTPKKIA